jgi:hypothetical protein
LARIRNQLLQNSLWQRRIRLDGSRSGAADNFFAISG